MEHNTKDKISYFKVKPSIEITADSGKQTIGEKEDIGATLTIEEGAVLKGKNLTLNLTLKACIGGVVTEFPYEDISIKENLTSDTKEPEKIVRDAYLYKYKPATSFYAIEKNDVDFQHELTMTVTHSIDMEGFEDFSKTFVFHLHQKTATGIKYIATKHGNFSQTADGVTYGQLQISNYYFKFSSTLFVRLVYRKPKPSLRFSGHTSTTNQPTSELKCMFLLIFIHLVVFYKHMFLIQLAIRQGFTKAYRLLYLSLLFLLL